MVIQHRHQPGSFDPAAAAAHEADLLDHYWQVQREEPVQGGPRVGPPGHRHATWALWSSGVGMLLAVIAVVTG